VIPRVRPSYSLAELRAAFRPAGDAVVRFEQELAAHFGARHALVFPYGRSAIYSCLRALDRAGGEVVQPAYNCVVVAHATVVAGYRPAFVDVQAHSPNQDPQAMIDRVGPETAAVVPTSMFGYSFDAPALCNAIRRRNPTALIIADCCQCFDARWQGELLATQGDVAVLAFGIGKPMTSLYGGALLTNRDDVAQAVRRYRDSSFRPQRRSAAVRQRLYLLASWLALSGPAVRLTDFIENGNTPLRRYLVTLRAREAIRLPVDNELLMTAEEAAVGRVQLRRVAGFLARRRAIAGRYARELSSIADLDLLVWPDGSAYAIYAARLRAPETRASILAALRRAGVQGDKTLSYVVPGLQCYRAEGYGDEAFPNAVAWASSVINLPNHPTLTEAQVSRIVHGVRDAFRQAAVARTDVQGSLHAAPLQTK